MIKWHEKYGKPVIVTEYGADTIAGLHKLPEVIFSEEYQKRCIEENNKAMDECDFVIGEHIWAFADFMTAFGLKRVDVYARVFTLLDDSTEVEFFCKDGDEVKAGQLMGIVTGDIRVLLSGERVANA